MENAALAWGGYLEIPTVSEGQVFRSSFDLDAERQPTPVIPTVYQMLVAATGSFSLA